MAETVVQIKLGIVNVFLVRGADGAVLVDTGSPNSERRILKRMADLGVEPADVRLILVSHGHIDHFGSLAAMKEATGAPVAVHALDADAVRQGVHQPDSLHPTGRLLRFLMRFRFLQRAFVALDTVAVEPDVVFESALDLTPYGIEGKALSTPGHTPGSVTLLLENGEVIVGDMVMGKLMGFVPAPGPPIVAWDLERNQESVRQLLARSPDRIYTGHGGPFSFEQVEGCLEEG
jgi:glyoxylase-like metal-dependent hydrolase (beta-lactamase superfamily II)